jgi:signal transduction histidine kinase
MATGTKSSSFSNLVASWTKRFFVRSRSLPIAVGVALLTTTLILWQALLAQERADIEQAIQLEASNANFQITRQLQERSPSLRAHGEALGVCRQTTVSQGQCTDACMDEKLLRHILSNLLSNAIKYSPAGGTIHFALACQYPTFRP